MLLLLLHFYSNVAQTDVINVQFLSQQMTMTDRCALKYKFVKSLIFFRNFFFHSQKKMFFVEILCEWREIFLKFKLLEIFLKFLFASDYLRGISSKPYHFLCNAAVSNFGSGFLCNPDKRRFNSAIARPGFKPYKKQQQEIRKQNPFH